MKTYVLYVQPACKSRRDHVSSHVAFYTKIELTVLLLSCHYAQCILSSYVINKRYKLTEFLALTET